MSLLNNLHLVNVKILNICDIVVDITFNVSEYMPNLIEFQCLSSKLKNLNCLIGS